MVREQDLIQRLEIMVAGDGVEPPTPAFSGLDMPIVIWLVPKHLTRSAGHFYGLLLEPNGTNGPVGVCLNSHRFGFSFHEKIVQGHGTPYGSSSTSGQHSAKPTADELVVAKHQGTRVTQVAAALKAAH